MKPKTPAKWKLLNQKAAIVVLENWMLITVREGIQHTLGTWDDAHPTEI